MAANDEMDPAVPVAVLKVISDHTGQRYDLAREDAAKVMAQGDRRIVRSPLDGAKLGAVYVTDPKPQAIITDRPLLTEWFEAHYPDLMETGYEICGSDSEVIEVLFVHAQHLLRPVRRITGAALSALRKECAGLGQVIGPGGEADVPGMEIEHPDGVVGCKPGPDALAAVQRLFAAGWLTLDGTLRPALEASDG